MYKIIRKYSPLFMFLLVSPWVSAYAVQPGFYIGTAIGPARTKPSANDSSTTTAQTNKSQLGLRLFLGYKANDFIGFESGLSYFSSSNDNSTETTSESKNKSTGTFDILGKTTFPFGDKIDVFAKLGASLASSSNSNNDSISKDKNKGTCGQSLANIPICPTIAIGVDYAITDNWVTNASWTRIMFGKNSTIKTIDFVGLGISYHFVDKFCGQFLC